MYRLIVESILGLKLEVDKLSFDPCLPEDWDGFKMRYRYRTTTYNVEVIKSATASVIIDGLEQGNMQITLLDDQNLHEVKVHIAI